MTDPNPTVRMPVPEEPRAPAPPTDPGLPPTAPASATPVPPSAPTQSGWATPPAASRRSDRSGGGRTGTIVFGAILLAVGIWFFLERSLGLELPDISWSQFWPVILIVIGGWLVLGSWRSGRS